ncbi:hypothetical protein [Streptomyces sp. NBC_01264]|uniref:hypothetical protein n=1 Tax=Streptomyces sp. NBC_01264 TaxID=2903804 RepID=UPI002252F903|nr:hypothetical protein [Streptomyces sp. NBC_01264]MCX4779990.1 hypothetical protein [Streptomyces sp. NBC_01264]
MSDTAEKRMEGRGGMSKIDDDFESSILMNIDETEDADDSEDDAQLPEALHNAVAAIEAAGFERGPDGETLDGVRLVRFVKGDESKPRRELVSVALGDLVAVAEGLAAYQESEEYRGILNRDGSYVEFMLQVPNRVLSVGRIVERMEWEYRLSACGHSFERETIQTRIRQYSPGFHLAAPNGDACVELSKMSPTAGFLMSDGRRFRSDFVDYTLKVMCSSPARLEDRVGRAQQVADSVLFELDAKFDLALSLKPRESSSVLGGRRRLGGKEAISFPSTEIPREVAALFSFASEAVDNPPFSFLSYYQVLEYYMPLTSRRDALKRIRREIRDFSFNVASDASVLRVLNATERAKGVSEEDVLKILVRDCVREDRLLEFFEADGFVQHFSQNGPIAGVSPIRLKGTNEPVATQVAKRVYALRNRIVHAKDDPKYAERPQLLPRGNEANSLGPDIRLARFIALETISDTQD